MRYRTAVAFRTALEQRVLVRSRSTGMGLTRLRKLVAFERLLACLVEVGPDRWILKGGLALDFRLRERARSTVDMDLARHDDEATATADFAAAQSVDLGDYFMFQIERTPILDEADVAGAVRYRVQVALADRRFEEVLVDVGFGDPPATRPDELVGPDFLIFAGLPQIIVQTLPLPEHVAEKVHAYTRLYGPSQRPSTRVKDLIDLVLVSSEIDFLARRLRLALRHTFESRATHPLPGALPPPPGDWGAQYRRLARPLSIPGDVEEAFREAVQFLDPVLAGRVGDEARWDPERRAWTI